MNKVTRNITICLLGAAMLASCKKEPVPVPSPQTDKPVAAAGSVLRFTHDKASFHIPVIVSEEDGRFAGDVFWGDGLKNNYNKYLVHDYKNSGQYEVVIKGGKAASVSFEDIVGVNEIDLAGI